MLRAHCHCGAVTIEIARRPDSLTHCNCSICRRYGTLWAYPDRTGVKVTAAPGAASSCAWGDRTLRFVRCATCGCVTPWEPVVAQRGSRVGVNARNFDPEQLGDVRICWRDGAGTEQYLS